MRHRPTDLPCTASDYKDRCRVRILAPTKRFTPNAEKFVKSIDKRFRHNFIWTCKSGFYEFRVSTPVFEAIELYHKNGGFGGLTLNQFIRKTVPSELRSPNGKSNR